MHRIWPLVLTCAVLLPTVARSKTIDVDMSVAPAIAPSANKASAVIKADAVALQRLFRSLHQEARAGRVEARLAGTIASELLGRGFEVAFGSDGTEVVATLSNGPGPVLIYRADTGSDVVVASQPLARDIAAAEVPPLTAAAGGSPGDVGALPSQPRSAQQVGITWMLGMARALTALRDEWTGTLVLISQPTRLLGSTPTLRRSGAEERLVPRADMVLALRAASTPLGSILSVRGQRRGGSDTADVVMSRIGVYEAPRHAERVASLAASTTRLYGLPENAFFGYLLVGIAPRSTAEIDPTEGDLAEGEPAEHDGAALDPALLEPGVLEPGSSDAEVDLAAIPLGTRLATVAVLELLDKTSPHRKKAAPSGRGWTLHPY
jgi:hypothetical protein